MVTVLIIGLGVAMKKPNILLVLVKVQVEQQTLYFKPFNEGFKFNWHLKLIIKAK